jgi:molecular chaperone HtpG
MPKQKRVLEVNIDHPVMAKFKTLFETDTKNSKLTDYCTLLFDMALIGEGGKIDNPSQFSKIVGDLMADAI